MLKESYDVVVVGAGPGGSSVATHCAKAGLSVALLEKRQEIGSPKRCGEGLSLNSLKMIENYLGKKIPSKCIAQEIDGAIVYAPNGKKVIIDFKENAGAVMERKIFDKWLAEEASRAGAYVQAKTYVKDIIKKNGYICGVTGEFEDEYFEIKAKVVVAADGVESKIARLAGLDTTNKLINIDSGYQFEMVNLKLNDPKKIELYFGNNIAKRGYCWIFPKGKDVANVGIGIALAEKPARYYLEKWIETKPEIFNSAGITEVNSGGIPVGGFLENMVLNGFLVVGDAAHQVNPIHGGGMKEATIAGKIAADVIVEAIKKNNVSKEVLDKYNKIWWKERGNELLKVQKLREVFEKLSDEDLNMLAEVLTGDDLIAFSRGSKLGTLAKILIKNPKIAFLAKHLI
ncbi:MAG: NAD(P)/FAD-dependent oxidoreductase [Candidatus Aenigmarchaeota archaeon]|nr:NAD(P)/FAD-dependent oxidoreductase [Candidatus Aenigmarchaeota archaeon]